MQPGGLFTDPDVVSIVKAHTHALELNDENTNIEAASLMKKRTAPATNFMLIAPDGTLLYEDNGCVISGFEPSQMVEIVRAAWRKLEADDEDDGEDEGAEKPAEKPELSESDAYETLLNAALVKAAATPKLNLKGRLERAGGIGDGFMRLGGGPSGTLRVSIAEDGTIAAALEGEDGNRLRVWRRGDTFVQRYTWAGSADPRTASFATEVTRLVEFNQIRIALSSAKDIKRAPGECEDGCGFVPIAAIFRPSLLGGGGGRQGFMQLEVSSIRAVFFLHEKTGALSSMRFVLQRELPSNIQVGGADPGAFDFSCTYHFGRDDEAKPLAVPPDIRKMLER